MYPIEQFGRRTVVPTGEPLDSSMKRNGKDFTSLTNDIGRLKDRRHSTSMVVLSHSRTKTFYSFATRSIP